MHDLPDSSESLILRVRDPADAEAWARFVAIYRPVVYRLARSRGLQDVDAQDLAQQVLVLVARSVDRWEPGEGMPPFRAWLLRIARNEILKALTRRRPDVAAGSTSVQELLGQVPGRDVDVMSELLLESRLEAFRWAANEIRCDFTETTWTMFWETAVEGQAAADVASRLGRSTGAVYIARCRVMQRLKEKVYEVPDIWSDES